LGVKIGKNEMGGACWANEEKRGVYRGLMGNLREKGNLEDPCIDGGMILRWIFRKWDVGVWNGSSWLRIGTMAGTCECGDETSGSIKCREIS
jgi:hypothetical protein